MARRIRDSILDTRTARSRLKFSGKPYYRTIEPGLHLGYRRLATGAGKWVARHYIGDQKYEVETIGVADDFSDADGVAILDFHQATNLARSRMVARAHKAAGKTGPITVAAAIESYIGFLQTNRKSAPFARYAAEAFILPTFGKVEIASLTADQIRAWLTALANTPARVRSKKGEAQRYRATDDPEHERRRKASANRILTVLKAALNRAWREGLVSSDAAWRRVEPFESVEAARVRYLAINEAKRLIAECPPDFQRLVRGALETGARYGELCAMRVEDFNADSGTVAVRQSKSGASRHIILTGVGVTFFRSITAGRAGPEPLFVKEGGGPWMKDHQAEPMRSASARAAINPPISFHGLRHTWASHSVMAGVPLMVIAKNLGHANTVMVQRHYGHLAPSFIADAIRAGAPKFG